MLKFVEWFGSITGLLGSLILGLNTSFSGWGFVAFLLSNAAWLTYGFKTKTWSMVAMQIGFTVTSSIGVWRWLF